jgi:hypothetical protein
VLTCDRANESLEPVGARPGVKSTGSSLSLNLRDGDSFHLRMILLDEEKTDDPTRVSENRGQRRGIQTGPTTKKSTLTSREHQWRRQRYRRQ